MIIAGLQKTTLIDYPGKIACVVFLAGCNFRCPWCYSAELVLPLKIVKQPRILEKEFFDFLRERRGLLEGVVICGGEPTINKELPQFIEKIKKFGYRVKLDTNGSNPEMLKDLVKANLIDYVAMDIKSSLSNKIYENILVEGVKLDDIKKSVDFLKTHSTNSGQAGNLDFEFRTTVVPTIHAKEEFLEIAKWIGGPNIKYYLQNFRAEKTIDPKFSAQGGPASGGEKSKPFKKEFLEKITEEISPYFKICEVR
jgi:pyruvate formate lyase activating enzyme